LDSAEAFASGIHLSKLLALVSIPMFLSFDGGSIQGILSTGPKLYTK